MPAEGVIKFDADHERRPLELHRYGELICTLAAWREVMAKTGMVGQRSDLYGGAGYGNASARVGAPSAPRGRRSFLITGTQTAGASCVSADDFCVVERFDYRANRVRSHGITLPSSESLTHGAIYDLSPHIRFVFHAHTPALWRHARALRIPISDPQAGYGTIEMASEAQRLYSASMSERQIMAMGGHEDGVVVFGRTAPEAGQVLMTNLAAAYARECHQAGGELCGITR